MKTTIPIRQGNGEVKYYYDIEQKMMLLSHPIMQKIIQKDNKDCNGLDLTCEDSTYYENKVEFLKRNGFFKNTNKKLCLDGELSPTIVEDLVKNINHVVFEVTDDCNLRCKYCGYGDMYYDHDDRNKNYMTIDTIKTFMSFLYQYLNKSEGVIYFSFYGGEPLLNFKLIEQTVEYIESLFYNREIRFGMTTNGILLHKHINYLEKKNFRLLISFDGNKYNHSYRVLPDGSNSFDILYNNVKMIKEKHQKYFDENVSFNSVIHNRNNIQDVEQFFLREFGKSPRFSPLDDAGIRPEKMEEFKLMYNDMYEYLRKHPSTSTEIQERFINDPFVFGLSVFIKEKLKYTSYNYYEDIGKEKNKHIIPGGTCLPFQKKIFLTVNNKILPCERINQNYVLGTIVNSKVIIDFSNISEFYNRIYRKMKIRCSSCYRGGACSQCFFQIEHLDQHNICPAFADENVAANGILNMIKFVEDNPYIVERIIKEVVLR